MSWSIPIVRIAGIQLRIHLTFLLLIGWLAFGYFGAGGLAAATGRVVFVLVLFLRSNRGRRTRTSTITGKTKARSASWAGPGLLRIAKPF